ncbi:LysR substrate-binding domain-containing protein [Salinispirillum sp. LH 10-3-1]|uniref:LysR substrate-binding domain-containing protein n=1 Tax=Salinispirillum sp. LH 10-3-1 TaxID=2952525 RepID=A0AB38YJ96_9GAMM
MSELRQLKAFIAVADHGSFHAAADASGSSATAVSRAVKDLEHELGARLFNRNTRRVALTPAGERYALRCRKILLDLADARAEIKAEARELGGTLRIAAPVSFGLYQLEPLLIQFAQQHPQLEIDLQLHEARLDLIGSGFDVIIIGAQDDYNAAIPARKLCTSKVVLCAAPSYLAQHGAPSHPEDRHRLDLIDIDHAISRAPWKIHGPDGWMDVAPLRRARYSTNHAEIALRMAKNGLGIAPLPDFMVQDAIAQGELVRVLNEWTLQSLVYYAALPAQHLLEPKVTALLDHLSVAFCP